MLNSRYDSGKMRDGFNDDPERIEHVCEGCLVDRTVRNPGVGGNADRHISWCGQLGSGIAGTGSESGLFQTGHLGRNDDRHAGQLRPWAKGAKEGQVASTPLAAVWAKLQADWPTHAAWFQQDLPGERYLDWFLQTNDNPHFECWIMSRALPRVAGAGLVLSQELDELVRGNVPTNDMRWLELYARSRRLEELLATSRPIWLGDLRFEYERQAAELVSTKASSSDPRWMTLRDWMAQCRMPGTAEHAGTIADLQSAVELLSGALPGRFTAPGTLTRELAESRPRWSGLLAAVVQQDPQSLAALPALADEVRRARRACCGRSPGCPSFSISAQAFLCSRNGRSNSLR